LFPALEREDEIPGRFLQSNLKKCRCSLMDEMHESQRKVDWMDNLIRMVEKEKVK
jgi:hypothetical protein